MAVNRRGFLAGSALTLAAPLVLRTGTPAWAAGEEIPVGMVMDLSGPLQQRAKANAFRLGVEETNAAGGLLGRKVKVVLYDTQSSNQLYRQYAQQLVLNDKVVAVFGAVTSAAREIIRPIFDRSKTPYLYTTGYEGGVCDRNTFMTGGTVSQCLGTLVPYAMKRFGKKAYILGADYIFGQISEKWIRKYVAENGGTVVGSELFPLDAANFASTIGKIQSAKPDLIIDSFVSPPQLSFYGQWAAAGMKGKMPQISQTFGNSGQHKQLPKEVSDGIVVCYQYAEEMDTPENKAFVTKFHKEFGDKDYLGDVAFSDYTAWKLWAAAVENAGSLDREAVLKALESNLSVKTPVGHVLMDPKIHHCVLDMHIMEVRDGALKDIQVVPQVHATEMGDRCDLLAHPTTNRQFQPEL
jgi:branched-chain amino acid transport system substrate-binding protein